MKREYYTFQTIRRDLKDWHLSTPYLADEELLLFDTKQEAWDAAGKAAEEEVVELNGRYKKEEISFGVVEGLYVDQKSPAVVVEGYFYDTEWMTKRVIRKVVKQLSPGMYELKEGTEKPGLT